MLSNLPPEQALTAAEFDDPVLALAPDGSRLVYLGGRKLHVRPLDQVDATAIPGTEGAWSGFFSPDGQWVGFYGSDNKLKKVHVSDGQIVFLCDAPDFWGASWGEDDTILFAVSGGSGLARMAASGGSPSAVTTLDVNQGEIAHRWPEFLPGGKAALFTIWKGTFQDSQIALLSLETGDHHVILKGGSNARFSPTGHIVYAIDGKLMAVPFDLGRRELTGEPVAILEEVATQATTGAGQFSISDDGTLAYVPSVAPTEKTLLWVDRKGLSQPLIEAPGFYNSPRLSPDGRHLSLTIGSHNMGHVWLYDMERDALTRLSSSTITPLPVWMGIWTPDGTKITFDLASDIVWQPADGSGAAETLFAGGGLPSSWSPDGMMLVFNQYDAANREDIWLLSIEEGKGQIFLQTPASERGGVFSPDGRWIAYVSNESGRYEVYIRPFPGPGAKGQVSTEGGTNPVWARSGREIFYRSDDKMLAVSIEAQPALGLSKPRLLFEERLLREEEGGVGFAQYDVAPDGEHFVMIREIGSLAGRIHVVLNWAEELKQQVPRSRR